MIPITYYYSFDYDAEHNEFIGSVETGSGYSIFNISNIEEIRELISEKKMSHIDDIEGLALLLKNKKLITEGAILRLIL